MITAESKCIDSTMHAPTLSAHTGAFMYTVEVGTTRAQTPAIDVRRIQSMRTERLTNGATRVIGIGADEQLARQIERRYANEFHMHTIALDIAHASGNRPLNVAQKHLNTYAKALARAWMTNDKMVRYGVPVMLTLVPGGSLALVVNVYKNIKDSTRKTYVKDARAFTMNSGAIGGF